MKKQKRDAELELMKERAKSEQLSEIVKMLGSKENNNIQDEIKAIDKNDVSIFNESNWIEELVD